MACHRIFRSGIWVNTKRTHLLKRLAAHYFLFTKFEYIHSL